MFNFYFRYSTLNPSAFTRFFVACSFHTSRQVRLLTSQYTAQHVVVPSGYCPSSYALLLYPWGWGAKVLMFERALSTGSAINLQVCCLQIKPVHVRSGIARVNLCILSVQIMQAGTQWPYRSSQVMVPLSYL